MSYKKFSTNKKGKCTHDIITVKFIDRKNVNHGYECNVCGKTLRILDSFRSYSFNNASGFWERKKKNPIKVILI
jgi:hypothetical protein